jgi:undecaprenyl-diphosphatase
MRVGLSAIWGWLRQREPLLLLAVLVVAGGVWSFVELAEDVMEGDTHQFDRRILLWMRAAGDLDDPIGPAWLEVIGRDVTALGGAAVLAIVTVTVLGGLMLLRQLRPALLLAVTVPGGWLLVSLLKLGFDRPRPEVVAHQVTEYSAAFPSGHATMAGVTYLTIAVLLAGADAIRRARVYVLACATVLTVLVGISRVYLGVHWPTDVLAGWAIGASWALLCWLVVRVVSSRWTLKPEEQR